MKEENKIINEFEEYIYLMDGIKDFIPIVLKSIKGVNCVYSISQAISDCNLNKQAKVFIKEMQKNKIDSNKLKKFKSNLSKEKKKERKIFERILLLINKSIDENKTKLISDIFSSMINEEYSYEEFCEYTEIIDKIFIQDLEILEKIYKKEINTTTNLDICNFNRLYSIGLIDFSNIGLFFPSKEKYNKTNKFVSITDKANKLCKCIFK